MCDHPAARAPLGKLPSLLLDWYDAHARNLPWRVSPQKRAAGTCPDPYRVWLSEVMLQQTTVAAVAGYFTRFTDRWPHVGDLAAAQDGDVMGQWAGLGYYARARNLLKCARVVADEHGGVFPADHRALLQLPGIGPYTAAAISAIAFDLPVPVMDSNVERVMARLFDVHTPLPAAKPVLMAHTAQLTPAQRPGDYAQAVMDLGATICTPRNPACGICPWAAPCAARAAGTAATLPRKIPKKARPTRRGAVFLARSVNGAWLLERRPERGLLGGMLGWPGEGWTEDERGPPLPLDWQKLPGEVRHTFTHFHLILNVYSAETTDPLPVNGAEWIDIARFRPSDLPTAMRKAYDLARSKGG